VIRDRTPEEHAAGPGLRLAAGAILALSCLAWVVHAVLARPHMWPAGAGVSLSGDTVTAILSDPPPIGRIRPPLVSRVNDTPLTAERVAPSAVVARQGVQPGQTVAVTLGSTPTAAPLTRFPPTPEETLRLWRDAYRQGPPAAITINDSRVPLAPVWSVDAETRGLWLRTHLGPILLMGTFLAGSLTLAALGSRGLTALLMMLALATTTIANGGPMHGAELGVPIAGELLLLFDWIVTPLSFPIFGLAVLYFPTRAPVLDRHRWIVLALAVLPLPMLLVGLTAAGFLLGAEAALTPLAWVAARSWIFDVSFAAALGANVAIVIEGIVRYRHNLDPNERRRIQIVVFTGVPAVFAYAIKVGVPLVSSLAGRPAQLPWGVAAPLQAIELLPAIGLPYAVAVRHVFTPRTVLRSGLQYALARRTLSVLAALPAAVLAFSLISRRDQPLGDIVLERPWFYAISLGLAAVGFRYRTQAQRWLDQRFFRDEYDAREILIALANRVPYENDPGQLVSLVLSRIDSALHPSAIAVLAGAERQLEVVSALRATLSPLALDGGLATLLRWSEDPLEVYLDDERSPAARLPAADRSWLAAGGVTLLVPILSGSDDTRTLEGIIALGPKRSEEPYTPEDRTLLSGIATQLSVAHDLSRLRRRASAGAARSTPSVTPSMVAGTVAPGVAALGMCPVCRRCYDMETLRAAAAPPECPDDGTSLQPVLGMVPVIDGKYRVDAVIGRGGMGAVFRARDLRLTRDVAVKVVRADMVLDPTARTRFEREAQIVARLQHPAIVTIFDYGNLPSGAAFLVMEYVAGEDLRHVLKRERKLAPDRTVALIGGVAEGIDAAHRAGVLHRDLKPENILLPASGAGPKVLDFGVAKMTEPGALDAGVTATAGATVIGTPAYMAPEQLRGDNVDGRADVFSLGVLTYEMLTGRLPFGAGSLLDIGTRHADRAQPLDLNGVPAWLSHAIAAALAVDRDGRPATAGAYAADLRVRLASNQAP
jgi:predicted Ser/Thr protein kinase